MAASLRFYRDGLTAPTKKRIIQSVVFFNTNGTKFELYPLSLLAEDIDENNHLRLPMVLAGITLAYNVKRGRSVRNNGTCEKGRCAVIAKEPQKVLGRVQLLFQGSERLLLGSGL